METDTRYDVVIVGAGVAGALMARELARKGVKVLILESGPRDRDDRKTFHETYLTATSKLPNTPYPPYWHGNDPAHAPDQEAAPRPMTAMNFAWPGLTEFLKWNRSKSKFDDFNAQSYLTYTTDTELPFLSTYERLAGGTTWHWLGTALRFTERDFRMKSTYGQLVDWPITLPELYEDYARAEEAIGVSADVDDQRALEPYLGPQFPSGYDYPMRRIPMSVSDKVLAKTITGLQFDGQNLEMTCTPQGRNSEYRNGRPACQGNSSCIPICPIQAKYDATLTLQEAENTQLVTTVTQAVVRDLDIDGNGLVTGVNYFQYTGTTGNYQKAPKTASGKIVILAAHAIETVKILLMSNGRRGIANGSRQLGCNLMDHLCYLGYGLNSVQGFPYRGPRSGSGIESLRDGPFRKHRAAWRVDVGNVGWEWPDDDPMTSTRDYIFGQNKSKLNPCEKQLFGKALIEQVNMFNTRMMRLCYLVEQEPQESNKITLSKHYEDGLGLPRPEITYSVTGSEYTLRGIMAAQQATDLIFKKIGANPYFPEHGMNYSQFIDDSGYPGIGFTLDGQNYKVNLYGAGHIAGTYRMGCDPGSSVVNADSRCWEHKNLYLLGSGTFPTITTANPTLTIAALTFRASRAVLSDLKIL